MRRRALVVTALILLAAVIVVAFALSGRLRTGLAVDAAQVREGSLEVTLAATGTVETRGADLAFEIPGRVAGVHVSEGAAVVRGTVLASLDAADLHAAAEQAEAAAAAARTRAARAAASACWVFAAAADARACAWRTFASAARQVASACRTCSAPARNVCSDAPPRSVSRRARARSCCARVVSN